MPLEASVGGALSYAGPSVRGKKGGSLVKGGETHSISKKENSLGE